MLDSRGKSGVPVKIWEMASVLGFDLGEQFVVSAKWKFESRGNAMGNAEIVTNDFRKRLTTYDM